MAEYYAVLKKAVGGLEGASSEARRAVYDKARNALIGQLKAIDPPLSTSEISRQRLELEEAIRRVERESAMESQSTRSRPSESAPVREAVMEAPAGPSPQDVFRRAIQEAETRAATAPLERAPAQPRADAYGNEARGRLDRAPLPDYAPPPYQPPPAPEYRPRPASPQPRLAPDYEEDIPRQAGGPEAPPSPYVDRRDRPRQASRSERRGYREEDDRAVAERPARRSRLPAILLTLLIIGMLGGLAALGWSERATIRDLVASYTSKARTSGGSPVAEAPADDAASGSKSGDRLGDNGSAPEASDNVRVVQPQGAPTDAPAVATAPAQPQAPQATQSGEPLVAQKATLLEEPLGGNNGQGVTAIAANVTWRFFEDNDGPEVEANIDIPDRSMKVRLDIRRNTDATLPASHLVEATITTPSDFPGQGIRAVPRLVMKDSEDARGQPLIGASAKVADGFFWIALSAAQSDVATNLKLMRDANWVDLPMVYENGQRAILSMEKGTPGARAFEAALTSWGG